MFPYGKLSMSKTPPPPSSPGPAAARSRVGSLSSSVNSGKTSRLVRYPTQSNALRALLDLSKPSHTVLIFSSPMSGKARQQSGPKIEKPSPSERSKPSPGAMALLLKSWTTARPNDGLPPESTIKTPSLRTTPVQILDGASLGRLVRTKRMTLKLTQQQLAERAGVGRRFVSELEAGKPTIELGKALAACQALDLTLTAQDSHG